MVFKPLSHLARQSFGKTLTHGYAQSVVAATQSSYASSTTPFVPFGNHSANRFGRPGTAQLHSAFQNAPALPLSKADLNSAENTQRNDGDLSAYYEAWQKQQHGEEDNEWRQFQFTKRIGWNAPSVVPDGKGKERADVNALSDGLSDRGALDRAYTTSAVDDIKRIQDVEAEVAAISSIDEAIANVITEIQQSSNVAPPSDARQDFTNPTTNNVGSSATPTSHTPETTAETSAHSTPVSDATAATSVQGADSQAFSEHISNLHDKHAYAQIPPVFESMLVRGITPTVTAYNALLDSVICLPIAKHHVVPKALDVYADMLRRRVPPDTAFYTTLIQLLSRRASDVSKTLTIMDQKRLRYGGLKDSGKFLFASSKAEYAILSEDDALNNAIKLFAKATGGHKARLFSAETYRLLITACAQSHCVDDMLQIYTHMESYGVKPIATMFSPMIEAFADSGDLNSAVECYNWYKSLAIADDAGQLAIIDRRDNEVYAALVRAYISCGKHEGAERFLSKIVDSYVDVTENRKERLEAVQDTVVLYAFVEDHLNSKDFSAALRTAEGRSLTPNVRNQAMARICISAADNGDLKVATKAYQYLSSSSAENQMATIALIALYIRLGDLEAASERWASLNSVPTLDASFVEPTALYTVGLIKSGHVEEGLMQARNAFGRIRASAQASVVRSDATEQIDEGIEHIASVLAENDIQPSARASMSFMWAMIENGGLMSPVAEQMLAGLGPEDIVGLGWQDMVLALQVEAGLLTNGHVNGDAAHLSRFVRLLEMTIDSTVPLDERTVALIEGLLGEISNERPDLLSKWQSYQHAATTQIYPQRVRTPLQSPVIPSAPAYTDNYDPYAAATDYRGSTIIVEGLENHRNSMGLNEALMKFRNIRRAGRHPRYIAYAKLITAAAKEGRINLTHDILGMARNDMPYLSEYTIVRHGWSSILDAMVGACLTAGKRTLAEQFHQELRDIGAAPTANTFGLYITTLKESTKTFDEATEAVSIFNRALSEGVEPSSFLYNALIGKLGKARRIDDCLRYFQEMRTAGIRPTSVTYGTIVNALCRVSDERFAEELFDEMESMPNYKPRPAPYNSLMQFFLTTKRDSKKVLAYYERMQSRNIQPTMHTYKLLIDTHATLEPINLVAAEGILDTIRASGQRPEAVHYASLIHAKGCALHDMAGARHIFDNVLASGDVRAQACLYQALFESMVANHCVAQTEDVLNSMTARHVEMTPYIANTLIHGWAMENNVAKSKAVYESVSLERREPSTYEAMTRAFLTAEERDSALAIVREMLSRGYPQAVSSKILELVGHGVSRTGNLVVS